jgi:hypothetical protein
VTCKEYLTGQTVTNHKLQLQFSGYICLLNCRQHTFGIDNENQSSLLFTLFQALISVLCTAIGAIALQACRAG